MSKIKNINDYKTGEERIVSEEDYSPSKEMLQKTKAYPVMSLKVCATDKFEMVPDVETGGMRKRKYGAVIAMAVIPDLSKQQEPIMLSQDIPMLLVDSDNLEDLEERLLTEIRNMIKLTRDTLDGKVVPPTQKDYASEESK